MEKESGKPLEGELVLINRYTRSQYGEDEVYAFSVVLCDNDIDRDGERFSDKALEQLSELFVGVTGITDHRPTSDNQNARIFACKVESDEHKVCKDGRAYKKLVARAYVPKSKGNEEFILALDSGIKKEVSVGCAVKKRICSICGKDNSQCTHIRGKTYGGSVCYAELDEVTDAYEWSFVAVPAQKSAGVVKCYGGDFGMDIEKKLYSEKEQLFSADEVLELANKFKALQAEAAQGTFYRGKLTEKIQKLAAVALPELKCDTLNYIVDKMNIEQLDELKKALEKKAEEILPIRPQIVQRADGKNISNQNYKNI